MTIIGGTGDLSPRCSAPASFVLVSDALSAIWPRWLLLLGALLMALALFMQQGLWGLIERRRHRARPSLGHDRRGLGRVEGRS